MIKPTPNAEVTGAAIGIGVIDYRAQRLINLMAVEGRHLTQRGHPRHVRQHRNSMLDLPKE